MATTPIGCSVWPSRCTSRSGSMRIPVVVWHAWVVQQHLCIGQKVRCEACVCQTATCISVLPAGGGRLTMLACPAHHPIGFHLAPALCGIISFANARRTFGVPPQAALFLASSGLGPSDGCSEGTAHISDTRINRCGWRMERCCSVVRSGVAHQQMVAAVFGHWRRPCPFVVCICHPWRAPHRLSPHRRPYIARGAAQV